MQSSELQEKDGVILEGGKGGGESIFLYVLGCRNEKHLFNVTTYKKKLRIANL